MKEILQRNSRFLIDLNRAYSVSMTTGTQSLLSELDPQSILDTKKGVFGFNYQDAWKSISRDHGDLINLSRTELWERFFMQPFQEKLSGHLEQEQ